MKDDPQSIHARRVHVYQMDFTSRGKQHVAAMEAAGFENNLPGRLFLKFIRRMIKKAEQREETARLVARKTYEDSL